MSEMSEEIINNMRKLQFEWGSGKDSKDSWEIRLCRGENKRECALIDNSKDQERMYHDKPSKGKR